MIKRILIALDPDSETVVGIRYAAAIAEKHGASVTGLAVVDLGRIESGTKGGGIGSLYYAEKLRERLTEETRARAIELADKFEELASAEDLRHTEVIREGVPFRRITEEAKYSDLLVIGKRPHFFYSHPHETTEAVAGIVRNAVVPTLVVTDSYRPVQRALIAYDGTRAAARTMQGFARMKPFGFVPVDLLNVYDGSVEESELLLGLARDYLKAHGFDVNAVSLKASHPAESILEYAENSEADLIVAGADNKTGIKKLVLGSTTEKLITECDRPILVDR
jgi:nucleotide-binding universal stress UspA family protein